MPTRRKRIGSESEQPLILAEQQTPTYSSSYGEYEEAVSKPAMARDRTGEFASAIQSLQGRLLVRAVTVQDPVKAKYLQSYGEFMMIARNIGKNIASTYTKLEKLTILAKRKPLFNDQPTEIQELTYIIKEDLNSLNSQIARLQELVKYQNVTKTTSRNKQLMSHSSSVVIALQSKLASMSSQFKAVLEVRTENLKEAKKRRDHFSGAGPSVAPSVSAPSLLLAAQDTTLDMEGAGPSRQRQAQLVAYQDDTEQYLLSRAETMQNIESTIVELGGIFQQLAHMVKEQEEMVDRIDANVVDAEMSVEAAHTEILKYFRSVTSNRWLMIKIFGVLIFFFMFFLIFMA